MFQWLVDLIWSVLSKLGEWLLDILLWLLEWLYEGVNAFLEFITEIIGKIIELAVNGILDLLPGSWVEEVTAIYPNLQYIDSWIPVGYGVKLFVAYYGIKAVLIPIKWVLKAIPGIWG